MDSVQMAGNVASAYEYKYSDVGLGWREIGAYYKAKHITDICAANNLKPKKVLDCGAGSGGILHHLADWGFCDQLHAIDISDGSIETIRGREIPGLVELKKFDGYHIPYEDQSFDLVILSHVLEHVEHERLLLRELARVSSHQCIEIPIDFSPGVDTMLSHFLGYGHINIYTPQLLRFLLGTEGFEIVDDLPDIGGVGMREYLKFVLQKAEDTPEAREELRGQIAKDLEEFQKLGKRRQYNKAHNFTILTRAPQKEIAIMGAAKDG